jgi:poly(glycerol-phosphate) alpha-glucosyltransferase
VYDFSPDKYPGGIPKVVYELACQQVKDGHQAYIYTPQLLGGQLGLSDKPFRSEEGFVVYTPQSMGGMKSTDCIRQLARESDVIHGHNTYLPLNRYTVAAGRESNVPVYFHVHGALDPEAVKMGVTKAMKKQAYIRLVERRNLNRARCVFALTQDEKRQIQGWGINSPIAVVPNGINPFIEPTEEERQRFINAHKGFDDSETILYLGRINPKKAIEVLIDAFAIISGSCRSVRLVIAGDREECPAYTRKLDVLIKSHALEERITWTGFVGEVEKRSLLAHANVFSHATYSEGMAMSILEAMSAGLPTVVSSGCYMNRAVERGAAICAEMNASSLAGILKLLLGDADLREEFGRRAKNYVRAQHNWEVISRQITEHYSCSLITAGVNHT